MRSSSTRRDVMRSGARCRSPARRDPDGFPEGCYRRGSIPCRSRGLRRRRRETSRRTRSRPRRRPALPFVVPQRPSSADRVEVAPTRHGVEPQPCGTASLLELGCVALAIMSCAVHAASLEKMVGQASVGSSVSNTRSPESSCAPCVAAAGRGPWKRVNGPDQVPEAGQRAPATEEVQSARCRLTSPNQRSKTSSPPESVRWFVTKNGIRPCGDGFGTPSATSGLRRRTQRCAAACCPWRSSSRRRRR